MCSAPAAPTAARAKSGKAAPQRRCSVSRLTLQLASCLVAGLTGCGEAPSVTWVGVQDCAVGIPPQSLRGVPLSASQLPLAQTQVSAVGSGFYIRNFTLGPIGEFSCEAPQVNALFVGAPGSRGAPGSLTAPAGVTTQGQAAAPGRRIELVPFDCLGSDGRSYQLDGEGQADRDALFFNQTFTAWLGAERATLVCSTRFVRQVGAVNAGDAGASLEPAPFGLPAPELTAPDPLGE